MFTKTNAYINKKIILIKKSKQNVFFGLVIKSKNNTKSFLSKKIKCVFDLATHNIF